MAVCLSGGADSMALFHFLCSHREYYGIKLYALHVNHGLRSESDEEEKFVEGYCQDMGVECVTTHLDMNNNEKPQGMSTETWARNLRYDFFFTQAKKYGAVLATAHTSSDRAETVLFNITRGASLKGATGIPPVRDGIIRPLIDCTRKEIEDYCRENQIPFVNDATNFQDIYSRNKIRLNVIPQLKSINPGFEKNIGDFAKENLEIYTLLSQLSDNLYRRSIGFNGLDVNMLKSEHPAVVKNLIRNQLDKLGCLSRENIYRVYDALGKETFKQQLSQDTFCRIKNGRLYFYTPEKANPTPVYDEIHILPDTIVSFADSSYEIKLVSQVEFKKIKENDKNYLTYRVNYDKINGILKLRARKTGDKFTFYNRKVTKSLKKIFTEDKLPRQIRRKMAVLTDDNDGVIWLSDYGTNRPFVPDSRTEKVLIIKEI
ncbi:MAG: tRNA lysidine(34) synthetase TilS [Oscillospiraceae bacterium]|nr:tRNA lysidine(34) synthetase TilS [Oscillospiraceae bacterium]